MNSEEPATTLSLFISSPGDVGQERLIADKVIERLDAELGDGVELNPYFWEYEPFRITKDYQAQIPRPSEFDIVICILWSRFGSRMDEQYKLPPDFQKTAESGTEFEFVDAVYGYREKGAPDILVWRNETVPDIQLDASNYDDRKKQWEKLKGFLNEWTRDEVKNVFTGGLNRYRTRDDFEEGLERGLRKIIQQRLGEQESASRSRPRWPGNPYQGLHSFEYRHAPVFFGRTAATAEAVDHIAKTISNVWTEQEKRSRVLEEFAAKGVSPDDSDLPRCDARAFLLVWGASGSGKSSLVKAGVLPTLVESGAVPGVGEWRCVVMRPSDGGGNPFLALAHALLQGAEDFDPRPPGDLPEGIAANGCPAALPELGEDGRTAATLAEALKKQPESAGELVRGALATATAVFAEREKNHLCAAIDRDRADGRSEDVKLTEKRLADYQPKRVCLALVLDQMEELFSGSVDRMLLLGFFTVLDQLAAGGRVAVIGTLRSEFFSRSFGKEDDQKILGTMLSGGAEQKLAPPLPHELGQMIRHPAQAAGVRFEETTNLGKLDERIRDAALREPDSLPLLEFCLEKLYDEGGDNGVLEHREYGIDEETPGIGQLEGVLQRHAEEVFNDSKRLTDRQRDSLEAVILQLATEGAEKEGSADADSTPEIVRRTVPYEELIQAGKFDTEENARTDGEKSDSETPARALVDAFVEARLLTTHHDAEGIRTVSVTHEALLRRWDRVQTLLGLDENRRFLRIRSRVAQKRKHWADSGEKRGFLLQPGPELGEAEEQFKEHGGAFSKRERDFIVESISERERVGRKRRKAKNLVIGVLSVLTAVSMVGAGLSMVQTRRANLAVQEAATKALGAARQAFDEREDAGVGFARLAEAVRYNQKLPDELRLRNLELEVGIRVAYTANLDPIPFVQLVIDDLGSETFALSPEGNQIASLSGEKTVKIWSAKTGESLGKPLRHHDHVNQVSFSPDGNRIVTVNDQKTVHIWDATTGECLGEPIRSVDQASFSFDGNWIVTVSDEKIVRIWDASNGEFLGKQLRHDSRVNHVSFSPDGRRIATLSLSGTVRIWDTSTDDETSKVIQYKGLVTYVSFSPDGSLIVTASTDNTARIWDARTGKLLETPLHHEDEVTYCSFSPDGTRIATVSGHETVRIWDTSTAEELVEQIRPEGYVSYVSFSPDGSRIAIASGNFLRGNGTSQIWDASTGEMLGTPLRCEQIVGAIDFSSDGRHLLTSSWGSDGVVTVRVWDATTGENHVRPLRHLSRVKHVSYSPDGSRIVTACGSFWGGNIARIWDSTTGEALAEPLRHDGPVNYASFSPDGNWIATASEDKTAGVWDAATGERLGELLRHDGPVKHISFSPDGNKILTASKDGIARVWRPWNSASLYRELRHEHSVSHSTFSPDGNRIVTVCGAILGGNIAQIWDATNGEKLGKPLLHEGRVNHVSFSPDGSLVVTGSTDNTARIWDARTGELVENPLQHEDEVIFFSFSPNGRRIATLSSQETVRIWDISTGKELSVINRSEANVKHISFSPDGNRIVTVCGDILRGNIVQIWDATTAERLGMALRHETTVNHASFSPDGSQLITASKDKIVRIWDLDVAVDLSSKMLPAELEKLGGQKVNNAGVVISVPLRERLEFRTKLANYPKTLANQLFSSRLQHQKSKTNAALNVNWVSIHATSDSVFDIARSIRDATPLDPLVPFLLALAESNEIRKNFLLDYGQKRMQSAVTVYDLESSLRIQIYALGSNGRIEEATVPYRQLIELDSSWATAEKITGLDRPDTETAPIEAVRKATMAKHPELAPGTE